MINSKEILEKMIRGTLTAKEDEQNLETLIKYLNRYDKRIKRIKPNKFKTFIDKIMDYFEYEKDNDYVITFTFPKYKKKFDIRSLSKKVVRLLKNKEGAFKSQKNITEKELNNWSTVENRVVYPSDGQNSHFLLNGAKNPKVVAEEAKKDNYLTEVNFSVEDFFKQK